LGKYETLEISTVRLETISEHKRNVVSIEILRRQRGQPNWIGDAVVLISIVIPRGPITNALIDIKRKAGIRGEVIEVERAGWRQRIQERGATFGKNSNTLTGDEIEYCPKLDTLRCARRAMSNHKTLFSTRHQQRRERCGTGHVSPFKYRSFSLSPNS
jgi:hypothetical protein